MEKEKVNYLSVKVVLYRDDGKILTIRRTETAPSRPLHWDLPGGELSYAEDPKDAIVRETKEETGLEIEDLKILDAVSGADTKGEFWVGIGYSGKPKSTEVLLSYEHDLFQWVTPEEFMALKASARNKRFVELFVLAKNSQALLP